ncbi:DNA polymerase III subunit delta [Treponema phagedenis]|uniref:DNA-directed DNA polymerase n=2 Tax=Treponema phagedenis TaxID=162 RepID=A0A0B7GSK1_TREPH|nr:DNA polymerase III subunit delta [Treponema phagedenis]QSH99892.1 DNA polymerase III subunit delta [Treponema phagedenis]CEM60467.1 DNA polymerase III, delta subunit [Treponema phagedenis]
MQKLATQYIISLKQCGKKNKEGEVMAAPVWLFLGSEIGEKNTAIEKIKERAATLGVIDVQTFYAIDTRIHDVVSLLQNGSLFSDVRFIIFRSAELIKKKEEIEILTTWIKSAENTTDSFLILLSDETSIDKKIEAAIPPTQKKIFWELFENKKQEWIKNFFSKESFTIENEAVATLLELVENNTDALKATCTHLVLFFKKGARISAADIEELLSHNKEESPFTLFDALTKKKLELALDINRKLLLSKDSSPIQIIAGLTYTFRRLYDWHVLQLQSAGNADDSSLKKAGFISKKAIEQYRRAAAVWDKAAVLKIIALLNKTDFEIRSSGTVLQTALMEICLYTILVRGGNTPGQYQPY